MSGATRLPPTCAFMDRAEISYNWVTNIGPVMFFLPVGSSAKKTETTVHKRQECQLSEILLTQRSSLGTSPLHVHYVVSVRA